MIENIQTYQHCATNTYYATCISTKFGRCIQWAETANEAVKKLKQFVCVHWLEDWPEIKVLHPDNEGRIKCKSCKDEFTINENDIIYCPHCR